MTKLEFRDKTPKRRNSPKSVSRHQDHKPNLKEDFNSFCGYCHSNDRYRDTWYEVDHFIPQDFFKKSGNISSTDYFNLVYSCRACNNAKRSSWPSQSEVDFHINDEGFIDPCDDNYAKQFYRCSRGRIHPNSALGTWMHNKFKFDIRERQIELIWQLQRLEVSMQELYKEQANLNVNSNEWKSIDKMLNKGARIFYEFDTELRNFRD